MISRLSLLRAPVIPFCFVSYSLGQFVAICMVHLHRQLVLFDAKYKGSNANTKLGMGSKRPSLQPWLHNALYNYKATTWSNSTSGQGF